MYLFWPLNLDISAYNLTNQPTNQQTNKLTNYMEQCPSLEAQLF